MTQNQLYYQKHRETQIARVTKYITERRKRDPDWFKQKRQQEYLKKRQVIDSWKNKPCADCYGWFEPCQMEFDHRDPKEKVGEVVRLLLFKNKQAALLEMRKCDVVCSNCHKLRTKKQWLKGVFDGIHQ